VKAVKYAVTVAKGALHPSENPVKAVKNAVTVAKRTLHPSENRVSALKNIYILVNEGNDGQLSLLACELYKFNYSTYTDKKWKPLEINEWAKEFDVKPMQLE